MIPLPPKENPFLYLKKQAQRYKLFPKIQFKKKNLRNIRNSSIKYNYEKKIYKSKENPLITELNPGLRVIKRVFPFLGKIEMIEKRKERRARKERKGVSLNGKLFCLWIKICVYVLCEKKNETVELWSRKRNLWICFRFSRPNKKMWVVDSEVSFRIWVWTAIGF